MKKLLAPLILLVLLFAASAARADNAAVDCGQKDNCSKTYTLKIGNTTYKYSVVGKQDALSLTAEGVDYMSEAHGYQPTSVGCGNFTITLISKITSCKVSTACYGAASIKHVAANCKATITPCPQDYVCQAGACIPPDQQPPDDDTPPDDTPPPDNTCDVGQPCTGDANACGESNIGVWTSCDPDSGEGIGICDAVVPPNDCNPDNPADNNNNDNSNPPVAPSVPVGTVSIKDFYVNPNTINPAISNLPGAGVCNTFFDFNAADDQSSCTITDQSGKVKTSFTPASSTAPSTYAEIGVNNETTYKLSCSETDPTTGAVSTTTNKYATCYINSNYQEVNPTH